MLICRHIIVSWTLVSCEAVVYYNIKYCRLRLAQYTSGEFNVEFVNPDQFAYTDS